MGHAITNAELLAQLNRGAATLFCTALLVTASANHLCARLSVDDPDSLRSRAWHWGFSAQQASFFATAPIGLSAEVAIDAKVVIKGVHATISFGLQPAYFPSVGKWDEAPFNFGHLKQLNLSTPAGTIPGMTIGNQWVNAGDVFLIDRGFVPFYLSGFLSLSPSGEVVLEYDEYVVSSMRASMWGLTMPVRVHIRRERRGRVMPFVDLGLGFDMVRTKAEYEVYSDRITYAYLDGTLNLIQGQSAYDEPFKGEASRHLLFTRAHVGAGARFRRFSAGVRAQRMMAKDLTYRGAGYERVRGNILAIPFLAGAAEDADLQEELDANGVALYGRSGLAKKEASDGSGTSDDLFGISRFWDRTTWVASLTFWLR